MSGRRPCLGTLAILLGLLSVSGVAGRRPGVSAVRGAADVPAFPADHIWNTPVDSLPLDPQSDTYVATIGASRTMHPDFGSGLWDGGPIGIPFVVVAGSQPKVAIHFTAYGGESDPGPYPVPPTAPVEGGNASDGDRHVLVIDPDHRILYELYRAFRQPDSSWNADSGAVYDLDGYALRPDGWTSADAAGLPIYPGLVRYDEVASGEITHALRFTVPQTRRAYVWPARHFASDLTGAQYPPMGQRFRLKAGFDLTGFSPSVQVILRALKKYGMILADNGSAWYLSGAPDERWDNDVLAQLARVHGSDFEAVDCSSLRIDPDSGRAAVLRLTSPNGGESWQVGASYAIGWEPAGLAGNVTLELWRSGSKLFDIGTVAAASGRCVWTVPAAAVPGSGYTVRIVSGAQTDDSDAAFSLTAVTAPALTLSRTELSYAAVGAWVTSSQQVSLYNSGAGSLDWTAASSASWLSVTPASGSGDTEVAVAVDAGGLAVGTYRATVTFQDPVAANTPLLLKVELRVVATGASPFGYFDTPTDGRSGVTGSIAVTGWALDDVEVTAVRIYRDPLAGEAVQQNGKVYIGDANLVEGARPDVLTLYPDTPRNTRAGWGYMLLTPFLPDGGNGTFRLHAVATDREGHSALLGSKRITCDNAHATLPFGTIDTPEQGGTALGSSYVNFGWALTPQPATIPTDGSTLWVWVDGVPLGHPVYDQYRDDIATLFPGYANSGGAVGYYYLDPSSLAAGVHTIAWSVRDDQGREDGIGSRYFSVSHDESSRLLGTPRTEEDSSLGIPPTQWAVSHGESFNLNNIEGNGLRPLPPPSAPPSWEGGWVERNVPSSGASSNLEPGTWNVEPGTWNVELVSPLRVRRGFAGDEEIALPAADGSVVLDAKVGEPLRIRLGTKPEGRWTGRQRVLGQARPLPAGSRLDPGSGTFSWLPGPGFAGTFELEFFFRTPDGSVRTRRLVVRLDPRCDDPRRN